MTYTINCKKCLKTGDFGIKNSCCFNCSNPDCPDYGECNCVTRYYDDIPVDKLIENMKKWNN